MMNLSSLSKATALVGASVAGLIVVEIAAALGLGSESILLATRVLAVVAMMAGLFYLARTASALGRAATVCENAAKGDLEARILEVPEAGSIGRMQRGINNLLDIADAFVREAQNSASYVSRGKYYRKVLLRGLPGSFQHAAKTLNNATENTERKVREFAQFADAFEANVGAVVASVSTAAKEMHGGAETMSRNATQTSQQVTTVAAATEQASTNVRSVASATEELAASVAEVGRQVTHSTEIARLAVEKADRTNDMVGSLADAAQKVGEVMQLIQDIASETNLLALNATIEAARAGEAGKGFAVVAGEVKSLAAQTAKATTDIADQIGAIRTATDDAVAAIKDIAATIGEMNAIAGSIAAAVEQQNAATSEIARNVQEAAAGTQEVSSNIVAVKDAALETGATANEVFGTASQLSAQADKLKSEVTTFMQKARAA